MGLITKGMGVILRNRASKKIFKEASGLQHPVIKSVKPKPTKGESTKVWGDKLSRSFKKKLDDSTEGMDKVLISANKILQKVKGEKITKSGISKGKDIKK